MTDMSSRALAAYTINYTEPGHGRVVLAEAGEPTLSALMIDGIRQYARSVAGDGLHTMLSVTLDLTEQAFAGGEVRIRTRTDRHTRSLLFASGEIASGEAVLIKATALFRMC